MKTRFHSVKVKEMVHVTLKSAGSDTQQVQIWNKQTKMSKHMKINHIKKIFSSSESPEANRTTGNERVERNFARSNEDDCCSKPKNGNYDKLKEKIEQYREKRKKRFTHYRVLKTVKRSNKLVQALALPKIVNLNPQSIYNKVDEFCTFVEEEGIDIVFISESHER